MNDPLLINLSSTLPPKRTRRPLFVIALAVLVIYGASITFEFTIWDDHEHITNNPLVIHSGFESLKRIWTEPYLEMYMPLTYTFWSLEGIPARFVGSFTGDSKQTLSPSIYHLGTILLYFGCCYQVYCFLHRLVANPWSALLGVSSSRFIPYKQNLPVGSAKTRV